MAVRDGDYVILDSGVVALLCLLKYRQAVSRISGLRLIQHLFLGKGRAAIERAHILWVVPNELEGQQIEAWISGVALPLARHTFYVAPMYREAVDFADPSLVDLIASSSPNVIILCIGGGTQEKLAWGIKKRIHPTPPILCTGAAISFLTGSQARIPTWVDRACLGWLWRTLHEPKKFGARYAGALWNLPRMLLRYYQIHGNWH
jgi:UDP-N-acetyl-D-mannosaminuronic acid transferase (WecB/TagA/CpsF family)